MDQDVKFAHICKLLIKPKTKEENDDTKRCVSTIQVQSDISFCYSVVNRKASANRKMKTE